MPIKGVRLRCTPPKSGMLTWNTTKTAAAQNAARVIIRLSVFFAFRTHRRAAPIRRSATAHQTITQNRVNDPSSRWICATIDPYRNLPSDI
jgi:hypothetical protein